MATQIESRPAPRRWWLGVGLLFTLGLLCCQPTPTYAQNTQPVWGLPGWLSSNNNIPTSIAWGDADGDGDLDLAIGYGYDESPMHIYLNHNGHLETELDQPWTAPDQAQATSVAWGDIDGDGRLDLAVGNSLGSSLLYLNRGLDANGKLSMTLSQTLATGPTQSLAWGDVDGDGDLDLAVGNADAANQIYLNTGGQLALAWTAPVTDTAKTTSVALGDVTGDGRLDLVVGNSRVVGGATNCSAPCAGQPNKVYRNDGILANQLQFTAVWTATVVDNTTGVALGDINGDGKLDLAVGSKNVFSDTSFSEGNVRLYINSGSSPFYATAWQSAEPLNTSGIALGDVNGDGKLDLVAANRWNDHKVYLNQNAGLATTGLSATGNQNDDVSAVALGDMDGDGKLDLALAIAFADSRIHLNQSTSWQRTTFDSNGGFYQVAWGDVDGDGDLDLAVGNDEQANKVYLNVSGQLSTTPAWTAPVTETTTSIAWGDLEGDGDLDLAVGNNEQPNKVYRNVNGQLSTTPAWTAPVAESTQNVAWGDVEGDGDLDLAVGNNEQPNKVYRNDGNTLRDIAWTDNVNDPTYSLAWGDMDGDGDLDLAVGNRYGNNKVYRNSGGQLETTPIWTARVFEITHSVAWGDMDGDGDLDLAVGNGFGESNRIYRNQNGILETVASWTSLDYEDTSAVAWGDMDGDGDLDLAVANRSSSAPRPSGIYLNRSGELERRPQTLPVLVGDSSASVAWGDVNGDGALDLALGNAGYYYSTFVNQQPAHLLYPDRAPAGINLQAPDTPANFFAAAKIHNEPVIPFTYTLYHPASLPVAQVRAVYSVDGGGRWYPALAASGTITQNLITAPYPTKTVTNTYRFNWDVGASGFFGQSDNVILRLVAIPSLQPVANNIAGPFQQGPATAQTFPLRVRGSQVRVMDNRAGSAKPARNSLVYHLPQGQAAGARPIADQTNTPYHTDSQGYLQGRGQLAIGDRLVALAPITATESYTLYNMSATPTLSGLNVYTVTSAGVQTLTVSAANPLLLFNLDIALEWDARKDTAFVEQLKFDLRRTAEFLFDATDGQAALGEINLYHNKENWERADIRIYASNALIPNADPGGIVPTEISEIITSNPFIGATTPYSITYQPGRIRMGAVWNRFGEATGTVGEDWPRTLAHEFSHYAFYLYDNYLGLQNGVVVPVSSCTGTLMTNPFREDFSEFRTAGERWNQECGATLSAQRSGRADWQTITRFYPWLKMPNGQANPGPTTLPLAVTQVQSRFATTLTPPIDVAIFDLVDANGAAQLSGPQAQAVLYSANRLIDLGRPVVDKVEARGAHIGDRLCVYDLPTAHLGCESVTANDNFLTVVAKPGWQPEIVVSPVTSRTVNVTVGNVPPGLALQGQLYPENSQATPAQPFAPGTGNSYATTFQLSAGVLAGHIQIWVDEADSPANPRRESLTSYALGGSPAPRRKKPCRKCRGLAPTEASDNEVNSPAIAPDGQVLIYGNVRFSDGEFYALQKVNRLPTPPLWTTVVGDGYRILKSANAPDLKNTSILFRYRGQDVPAGEENFLSLYFWEEVPQQWRKLPTVLNRAVNEASAQAPGPGLYVLMSSLEIPLRRVGWNLVAYPVQATRPVSQALASLGNGYSTVYGYVDDDSDPWKVYDPLAPAWVNDLTELAFGQGYWINVTKPITWLIKGPDDNAVQSAATASLPTPPATFYGVVLPGRGLTPAVGQPVQAWINDTLCGESVTQAIGGQIVYSLNVEGDGSTDPNCLGPQQRVVITVAGLPLAEVVWQNDRVLPVVINGSKLYFPMIWQNP